MTKQEAVKKAKHHFGISITAQGSEEGTGYANRCYLMKRVVKKSVSYEPIGIGRTWAEALTDALHVAKEKGKDSVYEPIC